MDTSNHTELEDTAWYQVDMTVDIYWKNWSDLVIRRIHKRVLNHIKKETNDQILK